MKVHFDAVYEGGVLRPKTPLTLAEGQTVRLVLEAAPPGRVWDSFGLVAGPRDAGVIERVALDPEFGIGESR